MQISLASSKAVGLILVQGRGQHTETSGSGAMVDEHPHKTLKLFWNLTNIDCFSSFSVKLSIIT